MSKKKKKKKEKENKTKQPQWSAWQFLALFNEFIIHLHNDKLKKEPRNKKSRWAGKPRFQR